MEPGNPKERAEDIPADGGTRFWTWIPVQQACSICDDDLSPAVLLSTSHRTDEGIVVSLAAQACSTCLDDQDTNIEKWVEENDPWDEAEDFHLSGPSDAAVPTLLGTVRIEPRCVRCSLMPVDFVGIYEIIAADGSSVFAMGPMGQLCRSCYSVIAEPLQSGRDLERPLEH